jgi:hypothetical protein
MPPRARRRGRLTPCCCMNRLRAQAAPTRPSGCCCATAQRSACNRRTSSSHTSGTRQPPRTPLHAMRWPNEACDPAVVGPPNEPNATSPIVSEVEPGDRHSAGDLGVSAQAALVRRREDGWAWAGPPARARRTAWSCRPRVGSACREDNAYEPGRVRAYGGISEFECPVPRSRLARDLMVGRTLEEGTAGAGHRTDLGVHDGTGHRSGDRPGGRGEPAGTGCQPPPV